jgi:hypothetical protein
VHCIALHRSAVQCRAVQCSAVQCSAVQCSVCGAGRCTLRWRAARLEMFKVFKNLKVLVAAESDCQTISSRYELNIPAAFMVSLIVFLVVRLGHIGSTTMVVFPSPTEALTSGMPVGPTGDATSWSLAAGKVFNGPEGAVATTIAYALGDVLLKLTLATLEWSSHCAAGAHFGTQVPLVVLKFEPQEGTWSTFFSSLSRYKVPRLPKWQYSLQEQLEAANAAAKSGHAPWFDIGILLASNLTSPRLLKTQFLAVANMHCTEDETSETHTVDEIMHNCPRAADGTQITVTHHRWKAVKCSGDLVHPAQPRALAHLNDLVLSGMWAACVQNAFDLSRGAPGVCKSDPK